MEVRINKEIRDYQESIFFGLSMRQFICSILAIIVAIGIYFGLHDLIGQEEIGWVCILGAAPLAGCGFFKYNGMNAEQFVITWIKSEFIYPSRLVFKAENIYAKALEDSPIKEDIACD